MNWPGKVRNDSEQAEIKSEDQIATAQDNSTQGRDRLADVAENALVTQVRVRGVDISSRNATSLSHGSEQSVK